MALNGIALPVLSAITELLLLLLLVHIDLRYDLIFSTLGGCLWISRVGQQERKQESQTQLHASRLPTYIAGSQWRQCRQSVGTWNTITRRKEIILKELKKCHQLQL